MENSSKKILVVDDEKDLREAIVSALSYEGFTVISANDGEAGLALALKEQPNLIFLDIMMPKLDGVGMLRALRDDAWGKDAKVIIMTVLDDMEKMAEAVELGASEYVMKSDISLSGIVEKAKMKLAIKTTL